MIYTEIFDPPEVNRREVIRYSGDRSHDSAVSDLIDDCIIEALPMLSYRVCYTRLRVICGEAVVSDGTVFRSDTLTKAMSECDEAILFAATIGTGIDRLIARYSRSSPSRALIFQALGAERIESLCDAFCAKTTSELNKEKKSLRTRVSPGYGDMPLDWQRDIFRLLDCPRKICLSLNDSLLMSPSKSVTAFAGITSGCVEEAPHSCATCSAVDCAYRGKYES